MGLSLPKSNLIFLKKCLDKWVHFKTGNEMQIRSICSCGRKKVNPKSVLNLMAAMIRCGTEIEVECNGETEKEDLKALVDFIASGLGEGCE